MSIGMAIPTILGGFILPFLIRMTWGKMMDHFGVIGGWVAVTFVVALAWCINHGVSTHLIHQTGAWVDQAFSAGFGLLAASVVLGGSFKKALPNMMAAIVGGTLAAIMISLVVIP